MILRIFKLLYLIHIVWIGALYNILFKNIEVEEVFYTPKKIRKNKKQKAISYLKKLYEEN